MREVIHCRICGKYLIRTDKVWPDKNGDIWCIACARCHGKLDVEAEEEKLNWYFTGQGFVI